MIEPARVTLGTKRIWPNDCVCGRRMRFTWSASGTPRRECSRRGGCGAIVLAHQTSEKVRNDR